MKMTMRIEGGDRLARNLAQLSTRVNKNVLRGALTRVAAEPIRARASDLAPRDPGAPDLAEHIVISTGRASGPAAAPWRT